MPPRNLPTMPASAGAITSAKTIGLTTGTTSSLGLRALRAKRRRTRVAKARICAPAWMGRTTCAVPMDVTVADAVISILHWFSKGGEPGRSRGQAGAGQAQVDVVHGGPARGHLGGGQTQPCDPHQGPVAGPLVQRHGQGRAPARGTGGGHPTGPQGP